MRPIHSRASHSRRAGALLGLLAALLLGGIALPPAQAGDEAAPTKPAQPAPKKDKPKKDEPKQASALERARAIESDLVEVLEKVSAASVTVIHHAHLPKGLGGADFNPLIVNGAGSGVLVDFRGTHVVTNAHVVKDATNVVIVTRDGTRVPVKVLASDTSRDLAVLGLPASFAATAAVPLASGKADLREGAWVLATGNPFMLAHDGRGAASLGVFSGVRTAPGARRGSTRHYLLQHDAEINPGNSGGPLWSRRGELIGINGAIVTRSMRMGGGPSYTGTSISVPIPQIRRFLERVLKSTSTTTPATVTPSKPAEAGGATTARKPSRPRTVRRIGFLGLRLITSRDAQGRTDGALVIGISKKSALRSRARGDGLQSGDRITHVSTQGKRILVRTRAEFEQALRRAASGERVSIHFVRHGQVRTWSGAVTSGGT